MLTATALAPTNPRADALRAARTSPDVEIFTDPVDGTELVTIPDAAKLTGVQPRAIYTWITKGYVRTRKRAGGHGHMRVVLADLWEDV